jgi:hypothetical protein
MSQDAPREADLRHLPSGFSFVSARDTAKLVQKFTSEDFQVEIANPWIARTLDLIDEFARLVRRQILRPNSILAQESIVMLANRVIVYEMFFAVQVRPGV